MHNGNYGMRHYIEALAIVVIICIIALVILVLYEITRCFSKQENRSLFLECVFGCFKTRMTTVDMDL